MLTSLTALLLLEPTDVFAAAPRPEDWVEGTGLVELILLCIAVFLLLVPFSVVRGLLRRRSLRDSLWEAWHFAIYGAFGIIGVGAGLVVLVGIPFGTLNMVGLAVTNRQYFWPIILPGLVLVYVFLAIWLRRQNNLFGRMLSPKD